MNNKYIYILFLLALAQCLSGQSLQAYIDATEEAMSDKDYYNAFYYARTALEFDEDNLELIDLHAEAARNFDAYTVADSLYQKVVDGDNNNSYPEASFYLAEMQHRLGKYEKSRRNYELFLTEYNGADEELLQRSHKSIRAIEWAQSMKETTNENVIVNKYPGDVNTPYSEFGAIVHDDEMYYSSLKFKEENSEYNPSKLISKVLKDGADEDMSLDQNGLHTAHTSFTRNGKKMFYTLCQYENSYDIRCDIFYREILSDSTMGEAIKLDQMINMQGYTSTQPTIGFIEELNQEVLFFASDKPGGKGKMDIWFSMMTEDGFSNPRNLESVNTVENEITPFYHTSTSKLYFSSDGYLTLGGYDVYSLQDPLNSTEIPVNIGLPINSSFNDIYYTLDESGSEALFSSNRIGSLYLEDSFEACCYDIYTADIKVSVIELNALTFEAADGEELDGVTVSVFDVVTNELVAELTPADTNEHVFILETGKEYKVVATKDGYSTEETMVSTWTIPEDGKIQRKLYLKKEGTTLDLSVFDKETLAALKGSSITVECMNDPSRSFTRTNVTSNDYIIELDGDCQYKITIHKEGYLPQTIVVDPSEGGYIQRKIYLSKDGASDLNELSLYLPVKVYYDNDDPEKRNFSFTTKTNYSDSYYPYIARKEEFKKKYSAALSGDMRYNAENNVERFFEDEVKHGFERLQIFVSKLLESLQSGNTIELTVRGYTSPRATKKYNLALGQRRVHNVINELADYGAGALKPYIDNGQLVFKQISFGEELSDGKVSDSFPNRRLSVFSPEASRERRAELLEINKIND